MKGRRGLDGGVGEGAIAEKCRRSKGGPTAWAVATLLNRKVNESFSIHGTLDLSVAEWELGTSGSLSTRLLEPSAMAHRPHGAAWEQVWWAGSMAMSCSSSSAA